MTTRGCRLVEGLVGLCATMAADETRPYFLNIASLEIGARLAERFSKSMGLMALLLTLNSSVVGVAEEAASVRIEGSVLSPLVEAETPARSTGVIERIAVIEGAVVESGTLLAQLDEQEASLALERAEIERDQAKARAANRLRIEFSEKALAVARAELQRSQESVAKFAQSVSESQLDVEKLTVKKLEVEILQARHDQELAQFDLQLKENAVGEARRQRQLCEIRAPFAGVVSLVRARPGEWVEPGTTICRLVAVDALRAEAFVDARTIERLVVGGALHFYPEGQAEAAYSGVLRYQSPESDPVTGQTRVWAEIDNRAGQLRPGLRGHLEIPNNQQPTTKLQAPTTKNQEPRTKNREAQTKN